MSAAALVVVDRAKVGGVAWRHLDEVVLPKCTLDYLETMVGDFGVVVSDFSVEDVYLFRLSHPWIRYLVHDANLGAHVWLNAEFEQLDGEEVWRELIL